MNKSEYDLIVDYIKSNLKNLNSDPSEGVTSFFINDFTILIVSDLGDIVVMESPINLLTSIGNSYSIFLNSDNMDIVDSAISGVKKFLTSYKLFIKRSNTSYKLKGKLRNGSVEVNSCFIVFDLGEVFKFSITVNEDTKFEDILVCQRLLSEISNFLPITIDGVRKINKSDVFNL